MSFWALGGLINGVASLILGLFVYLKNPKNPSNRLWILFTSAVAFWSYSYFLWQISTERSHALFWCRSLMLGAIFIPVTFLHFLLVWLEVYQSKKKLLFVSYCISLIAFVLNFTPFFVKEVSSILFFKYWPRAGIAYLPFLIFWSWLVFYCWYIMFRVMRTSSPVKRNQIKYVLVGAIIGFSGGFTNYPLWYGIKIPPYGNIFVSVYVGLMTYAIIKYHLLDIKVALTRAGIFVIVYALVLGIPFWLGFKFLGRGLWIMPVSVTALLATLGPFIYLYIDRRAEARLLKEQHRYQNTLKQASAGMTRIRNLRKLLDLITHIVTRTVKISFAAIYLYNEESNEFLLQVSRDKGRLPIPKLTLDNPLISQIMENRQLLIYEEVKRQTEDNNNATYKHIEENMRLLTASVIIPSFLEDRFMGFFVLGEKLSGQIYTPEDLNVFQILASQAALAIENAKFYEETKQMQGQIAQAEKMATIGTMADGLSHQINNRFYALSLIAGDTIDTIKLTDTSQCSPEIKEMINEINHALERIQTNVIQGGQVVKGILKYTRKGEEGFEALSLDQIIDGTLDMVQYKVKLSEIDIIRNYPKDHPKIKGNLVQLQENFFNFIDNAYDAIVERRTTLNEPEYKGKITISAYPKDGNLEITIEDNGMGIKDEAKKKLFTPFFTTKTSSRQGTGLGLYVVKRIIEEFHKGKIWLESEYGKGTKFFLQLPLA